MKRILIVAPYARWLPHWETDLEIAQRHLDEGDVVTLLVCNKELAACDVNPGHRAFGCAHCVARQRDGIKLVKGAFSVEQLIPPNSRSVGPVPDVPSSLDELRNITVENFDLGWAALSSLVSWTGDPEPDLRSPRIRDLLQRAFVAGIETFQSIRQRLHAGAYDLVYVFNGRTAVTRAVVRACEAETVPYRTHERGCDFQHFEIFENRLPHDLRGTLEAISAVWQEGSEPERSLLAEKFFQQRRLGVKQSWISYVNKQEQGKLPAQWSDAATNIAVFVSSEDELVAIGDEWCNPIYPSQADGIRKIIEDVYGLERYHFYIRMHPNQAGNRSAAVRQLLSLAADRLTVIPPESEISSYALLDGAAKVLSFGSTMGIEAAYWGKVSIVAGRSAFAGLGSTYEPATHEEVVRLISDTELPVLPRVGALAYGYYEQTRGQRFKYFEGTDVWEGKFKGRRITGGPGFGALIQLKRHLWALK